MCVRERERGSERESERKRASDRHKRERKRGKLISKHSMTCILSVCTFQIYFWWVSVCITILEIEGDGDLIKTGIIQSILSQPGFVLGEHIVERICNEK